MKRIFILSLALVLAGCQRVGDLIPADEPKQTETDEKEAVASKTLRCTRDQDSQEMTGTGDVMETLTQTFFISSDSLNVAENADDQALTDAVNQMLADSYGNLEGVTATGEIRDRQAYITVTIDFTKANTQQLIEKGLMTEGEGNSDFVSMRQVQSDLQAQGYACQ